LTKGGGNESKYDLAYEKPFNVQEKEIGCGEKSGKKNGASLL
jgi:hypothetical protein